MKAVYKKGQSPMERLRNKLTPFLTLAEIAADNNPDNKELLKTAKLAKGLIGDIHDHLDDLQEELDELSEQEVPEWAKGMKPESIPPSPAEIERAEEMDRMGNPERFWNDFEEPLDDEWQ